MFPSVFMRSGAVSGTIKVVRVGSLAVRLLLSVVSRSSTVTGALMMVTIGVGFRWSKGPTRVEIGIPATILPRLAEIGFSPSKVFTEIRTPLIS